jgi:hypothetical protein
MLQFADRLKTPSSVPTRTEYLFMDRAYLSAEQVICIAQSCIPLFAYSICDRPKEAFMGGHPFREIPCKLCAKPVDLTVDLSADENGKAVHEDCYVKHIASSSRNPPAAMMAD